jgi:hypothetical protein
MPHFDHLVCAHHNDCNLAELVGHIDVGTAERYHLSPVCLKLRKGHEAADLDRMLAYLQAHRAQIVAAFKVAATEAKVPQPWPDSAFHEGTPPAPKLGGPVRVGPRKIVPPPAPPPNVTVVNEGLPAPVVRRFPVKKVQA